MFDIQEQLKLLPEEPGVYLMKNKNDKIILNKDFTVVKDLTKDGYAELVLKLKEAWQDITLKAIDSLP